MEKSILVYFEWNIIKEKNFPPHHENELLPFEEELEAEALRQIGEGIKAFCIAGKLERFTVDTYVPPSQQIHVEGEWSIKEMPL